MVKNASHNALISSISGKSEFEITHPFHPDRGHRFAILHTRVAADITWLWYRDHQDTARQVKLDFTDLADLDDFVRVSAGRSSFHIDGLKELVDQVARLRRRLCG